MAIHTHSACIQQARYQAKGICLNAIKGMLKTYPRLAGDLLADLLKVEGYSEVEIAFGSGTPLEVIRAIANNDFRQLRHEYLLNLLGFYTRVFCGWHRTQFDDKAA